jgi:uncharacterized membrane protein (UPF0127 family)
VIQWLAIAWLLASCGGSKLPLVSIDVGGHAVTVEVAATAEHRTMGLMHRDHLPAERGMLFVYPDEGIRHFWMKDTRIPLSIAFADRTGKVVRIADMPPLTTKRTSSLYPVKFALEMNKGWFDSKGITPGVTLKGLESLPVVEGD